MNKFSLIAILMVANFFADAQNVGIGTNNPTRAKLEVHGSVGATSAIFGGESTGISLQRNWPGVGFNQYYNGGSRYISNGYAAVQFIDPSNGHMAFDMFGNGIANSITSASRRAMVITNDGRVTIGSGEYPPSTLYVARGNAGDGTAVFAGSTHRSHFNYGNEEHTYIRAGKDNGTVIINDIPGSKIAMSGRVGINTATPGYPLEIRQLDGKGLALLDPNYSNNAELHVYGVGGYLGLLFNGSLKGVFSSSNGGYSAVSDRRLKTNIHSPGPLLEKIMRLQPVEYEMLHNPAASGKTLGFIAQDVKEIFPELVSVSRDTTHGYQNITDLHTLNYSGFSVLAIKAIQEQQELIKSLQAELNELTQAITNSLITSKK